MDTWGFITILALTSPFWITLVGILLRPMYEILHTFDKRLQLYDEKGKDAGTIVVRSDGEKIRLVLHPELHLESSEKIVDIISKCFKKDAPWEAIRLSMGSKEDGRYPAPSSRGKGNDSVNLRYSTFDNTCIISFPTSFHFLGYMIARLKVRNLFKAIRKGNGHILYPTSDSQEETGINVAGIYKYLRHENLKDDIGLLSKLTELCDKVDYAKSTPYANVTNVRQTFNVHLERLDEMLGIYADISVPAERETARADVIEVIELLTYVLNGYQGSRASGERETISSIAESIKSMVNISK